MSNDFSPIIILWTGVVGQEIPGNFLMFLFWTSLFIEGMFIFQVYLKNFYIFIVVLQIYMQFFLFLETQKRLETHLSEILDKTTKISWWYDLTSIVDITFSYIMNWYFTSFVFNFVFITTSRVWYIDMKQSLWLINS